MQPSVQRPLPQLRDVDAQAFAARAREELDITHRRLMSELSAIIASQQESLLNDLVSCLLRGSSLPDATNQAEPAHAECCSVRSTAAAPDAAFLAQSREISGTAQDDHVVQVQEQRDSPAMRASTVTCNGQGPPVVQRDLSMIANDGDHKTTNGTCEDLGARDSEDEGSEDSVKVDNAFGSLFAANAMEEVDLAETHYRVEDYYHTEGCSQAIARNETFTNITLGVISLNAVYIGVDADWNKADSLYDAEVPFIFMDNAFAVFFTFELAVRFFAFAHKKDCMRDGWFRFDSFLVAIMIFETWIMAPVVAFASVGGGTGIPVQPLRLLRLLRLTRMTRLMRSLPELVTMMKGMKVASRAVMSSLMFVVLLIYIFAIVLNMLLKEEYGINEELAPRNFENIPSTMWTLLMDGTFLDGTGDVLTVLLFSDIPTCWLCCWIFLLFILFSAITVMNMLIGVLCEVVSAVAQAEKDEAAIILAKQSILVNLKKYDNGDGMISAHELTQAFNDKQSKAVLKSLNIDQLFLSEVQQLLFPKPDSVVTIHAVMELMLMCRGDLSVSVQHIASAQASLLLSMQKIEERLNKKLDAQVMNKDQQNSSCCSLESLEQKMSQGFEELRSTSGLSATVQHMVSAQASFFFSLQKLEKRMDQQYMRQYSVRSSASSKELAQMLGQAYIYALPAQDLEDPELALSEGFGTPPGSPRGACLTDGQFMEVLPFVDNN